MNIELLTFGGYGQFVWPAFIFTFCSCFLLYIKIKNDLKRHENFLLIECGQISTLKIKVNRQKKLSKEVLTVKPIY